MYFKVGLLVLISFNLFAGEQTRVKKDRRPTHHSKATRGRKRSQHPTSPLGAFAGCRVTLTQEKPSQSSQQRLWRKAEREGMLHRCVSEPNSQEQLIEARRLLEKLRVDPNMPYSKESGISYALSPLCIAALAGNAELAGLLLEYKADSRAEASFTGKDGDRTTTPLLCAAHGCQEKNHFEGRYEDVIQLLYDAGCDMNVGGNKKSSPFTALQLVALQRTMPFERQHSIMKTLLRLNANLSKKSFNGSTVAELARNRNSEKLAEWLDAQKSKTFVGQKKNERRKRKQELRSARESMTIARHASRAAKKGMWRDYSIR